VQVHRCFCGKPGTVPSISKWEIPDLGRGEGTIPLSLCEEHADLLKNRLLTMRVSDPDRPYAGTLHRCPECGMEHEPPDTA
jgi:hypothetical protein